ncbi:protein containing DUF1566 [Candidatus Magnetobacterium bavaricum]|uniref:Protein containing DUF1566 n=1 Tax=Candidatus Magnetobacterium bavaricum TaxID=29290 RepID=A0A0F3H233_9BACT|nr:protein containing DUF1566 [Candidatus Magnetobacterium bavaricum]
MKCKLQVGGIVMFRRFNYLRSMGYIPCYGEHGMKGLLVLALIVVMGVVCLGGIAYADTVNLPRTGQTTSYAAGDDVALRIGVAWPNPRFTDNTNTVIDNLTGLVWTKDANLPGIYKTWQQALDYVASMNSGASTYGHTDWRLPNGKELFSLLNHATYGPPLPSSHPFTNVQSHNYWSSTTVASGTSGAWFVSMDDGVYDATGKSNLSYVWPVRSGQVSDLYNNLVISKSGTGSGTVTSSPSGINCGSTCSYSFIKQIPVTLTAKPDAGYATFTGWSGDCTGTDLTCTLTMSEAKNVTAIFNANFSGQRFKDNGDGSITDTYSGYAWMKNVDACNGNVEWDQAKTCVASLGSGWSLPTIQQLYSLCRTDGSITGLDLNASAYGYYCNGESVDLKSPLESAGFTNVAFGSFYWSSETYANYKPYAWLVSMGFGGRVNAAHKDVPYYVWPVRSGQVGNSVDLVISKSGTGSGTVTSSPSGIDCGSTCSGSFLKDTSVTLTATPDAGKATFTGWSGDCTGSSSTCTVTMTADKNVNAIFADYCNYAINSKGKSFPYNGGSDSVNVTASSGCQWTATSGASWITISSGSTGTGNGTINYTVAPNTIAFKRTGTITIAGKTFMVTQDALDCSSYTITPTSKNFTYNGGSDTVSVTVGTGCNWTAKSNVSWITIPSGTSGIGNGTVSYSVTPNSGTTQRTGTMTIAGKAFTITQDAKPNCTSYTITPTSKSFTSSGGSDNVSVTSSTGCEWTATSNDSWIEITAGSSGNGNGTVTYTVAPNTNTVQRNGTITIAGKTFMVTQGAIDCSGNAITPTTKGFPASGGSDSVSVTAKTGCQWSATSNVIGWIKITAGSPGNGNGTVNYTVTSNTASDTRTGTMTIAGKTFTVTQDGSKPGVDVTLSVERLGNGKVTVAPGVLFMIGRTGTVSYTKDTDVTITAMPDTGSTIGAWAGCDSTSDNKTQCMIKMTENKNVTVGFTGSPVRTVKDDFNGDGNSDVLWRNTKTGDIALWMMNGRTIAGGKGSLVTRVSADWDIKAIKDLNGDGKSDVIWENATTGDVALWLMDGITITENSFISRGKSEWGIKALGDLDGDGKADIVWRNMNNNDIYVQLMDGTSRKGGNYIAHGIESQWVLKAVADLNGDGKGDVLWQNTATGDVATWLMGDDLTIATANYIAKGIPNKWQIKAAEDVDGDGKADIIWQNTTNGDVYIWLMDGLSIVNRGYVAQGISNWQLRAIGDYNGDGMVDIIWQNATSGDVYMRLMDGLSVIDSGFVTSGISNDWQVK